jgi:enoyl-CoA hydratase/carnithine racemase
LRRSPIWRGVFGCLGGDPISPPIGQALALHALEGNGGALNPEEALQSGLVNEVAPDALERARELAEELKHVPAAAFAAAKELVRNAGNDGAEAALARERAKFALMLRNEPEATALCEAFNAHDGDINDFIATRRRPMA